MANMGSRTLFSVALAALVLVAGCAPPAAISDRVKTSIDFINPFDNKPGKLAVTEIRLVATNPNRLWALVGDFRAIGAWHPWAAQQARYTDMDPRTEGAIRVLPVTGGGVMRDRLLGWDGTRKSIRYAAEITTLPVAKFETTMTVTNNLDGTSTVDWSAIFDAEGVSDDQAAAAVQEFLSAGLDNLAVMPF